MPVWPSRERHLPCPEGTGFLAFVYTGARTPRHKRWFTWWPSDKPTLPVSASDCFAVRSAVAMARLKRLLGCMLARPSVLILNYSIACILVWEVTRCHEYPLVLVREMSASSRSFTILYIEHQMMSRYMRVSICSVHLRICERGLVWESKYCIVLEGDNPEQFMYTQRAQHITIIKQSICSAIELIWYISSEID